MKGLWPQTLIRFYQLSIQISMNKQFLYLITVLLVISCDSKNSQVEDPASKKERAELSMPVASEKQLNINILWDLSDRINDKVNPSTPPNYPISPASYAACHYVCHRAESFKNRKI